MFSAQPEPERGGTTGHPSAKASPETSGCRLQSRATDVRLGVSGRGGVAPPPLTPTTAAAGQAAAADDDVVGGSKGPLLTQVAAKLRRRRRQLW